MNVSPIYQKYVRFLSKLPDKLQDHLLLTGGAAAYFFGSDRPFSNDIDFMAPQEMQSQLEQVLHIQFSENTKKPVFHSFSGHMHLDDTDYDIVLRSSIHPSGVTETFTFFVTPEIVQRRLSIYVKNSLDKYLNQAVNCVPSELLILKKLLAGRGEELSKYDLYDVHCILHYQKNFDRDFFFSLIQQFCFSFAPATRLIVERLEKISREYENPVALSLIDSIRNR